MARQRTQTKDEFIDDLFIYYFDSDSTLINNMSDEELEEQIYYCLKESVIIDTHMTEIIIALRERANVND